MLYPPIQDPQTLRVSNKSNEHQERDECAQKPGEEPVSRLPQPSLALLDQPADTEERIAETQCRSAENGKKLEPAERATGIPAILHGKSCCQGA